MDYRQDVKRVSVILSLCVLALLVALPFAGADIVLNGGFEAPDVSPSPYIVAPPGTVAHWTITSGYVDLVDKSWWLPAEGDQSVDLNANGVAGSIRQDLVTGVGNIYSIDFALTGNWGAGPDTKTMQVWWDGSMVQQFDITEPAGWDTKTDMGWQYYTIGGLLATSSSTSLEFVSLTTGTTGPVIDDVSVTPEPGTLALMAIGLAGLVAARRRRKNEE